MAARDTLAAFVAGGNMREADAPTMSPDRAKELGERVKAVQSGTARLDPQMAPSDFRAAVQQREQEAATKAAASRGADIPRRFENHPIGKRIYQAHDAIASLPAPGGLAALLVAVVVLFFLLIPATSSGETRALLLWEVILGQKQIPNTPEITGATDTSATGPSSPSSGAVGTTPGINQTTGTGSMHPLPVSMSDYPMSGAPDGL